MHHWPQGKTIRLICIALAVLIALDIGYFGAYSRIAAYIGSATPAVSQLIVGVIYAVMAVGALVFGIVSAGFHPRAVEFLIEVEAEMLKVDWPKPNALVRQTILIAILLAVVSGLVFVVDWVFIEVVRKGLTALGREYF